MPFKIARFKLNSRDWDREVGLVKHAPVQDDPIPRIGDIVRVNHHGPPFEAKVVWSRPSRADPQMVVLRVEEI